MLASCGEYRLCGELGRGGTGTVFSAEHARSGKRVAIKLLRQELSTSRQAVARFFHEARSAANVGDPGVVQIFEAGFADDGCAFLAMELLEGESLGSRLTHGPAISLAMLCHLGGEIARTLAAAHAARIIHRDLKPDNVFLMRDRAAPFGFRVRVLDFGMAKLNPDEGPYSFVTDKGALLGTPMYMSPEQCRGNEVDARSDVYALGCILHELACGEPPFVRGGLGIILGAHVYQTVPSLRTRVASLPAALDDLVLRALAKRPEHRQQSMHALAQELAALEATHA
jgi:eukaryotic-like serine/threonine-protein kinase